MKKCWTRRINILETDVKSIYGKLYFEEWLENLAIAPGQDVLTILNLVPEKARLQYLFRIFKKYRENQASNSIRLCS